MITVVSVKFKGRGKTYFFDPNGIEVPVGAQVVVETSKGLELCECVQSNHTVTDERIVPPLRQVVRIATADDLRIADLCKVREKEAYQICEKKIAEHGLDMKLVDVECNFEGNKMLFFFTSDGRVDFRELVKDLAGIFRTRIELRQIGVRDEAKMLGGIGMCGRPYCCSQFLNDFEPVSTKMAKTQSLSLNPTKISGCCGRLMCCLRYEEEAYEDLVKTVPKNGAFVETRDGYGNVVQVSLLRQKVKVKLDGDGENIHTFDADEVAAVPGGRPKPGEPLPHVLELKEKKKEENEPEDSPVSKWTLTPIFAEDTAQEPPAAAAKAGADETDEKKSGSRRHRSRGGRGRNRNAQSGEKPAKEASAEQQPKPEKPAQPKAEKAEAPAGEGGEKKSNRRHRSRGGRGHKPANADAQATAPQQQAKPKAEPQPKPAAGAAESGGKKPNHRRRPRHRKPAGGGNNAPKAE